MVSEQPTFFVAIASFCEVHLEEATGIHSAVRMYDVAHANFDPSMRQDGQKILLPTTLVFSARTLSDISQHEFILRLTRPDGSVGEDTPFTAPFNGAQGGTYRGSWVTIKLNIAVADEGVHWFDIYSGDSVITRVPLGVVLRPLETVDDPTTELRSDQAER